MYVCMYVCITLCMHVVVPSYCDWSSKELKDVLDYLHKNRKYKNNHKLEEAKS
jgi:hypothetical protein